MRTKHTSSPSSICSLFSGLALASLCAFANCTKEPAHPDGERDLSTSQNPDLKMELPDLKPADAAPDLYEPDLAMPFAPIPGSMLGTNLMVNLSCDYEKRTWVKDMMGDCQRNIVMNKATPVKTIRIDGNGPKKYRITAGIADPFAADYMVDVSEDMIYGAWNDGGDPVAATRRTHNYMLQPRSLQVETILMHDNDTPLPPPSTMCADYYFERTKCTGQLSW